MQQPLRQAFSLHSLNAEEPCNLADLEAYAKAAGWFKQAVAEMRQGDLHGRVDHGSLGWSLHQLGHCAFQQGQWSAAAGWFEQAVAEKRLGDIFGRVDQSSVANSERSLALCRKKMGLA